MHSSIRLFAIAASILMLSGCEPAAPIADDPDLNDQVASANYVLTYGKDAWTQHLVLPPVDDIVRRAWVPSEAGPGCAVGLVEDGEITYLKGYGMASMGDAGDPPAKWAYYTAAPVGSIAKTITALSLRSLDLEWANSLEVTDTVGDHLSADAPLASMPLTDLLSHASGLKKSPSWEDDSLPNTCGPGEILSCQESSWFLSHPRIAFHQYDDDVGTPGNPKYSNINYSVLGAVIDELTYDAFWLPMDARGYEAYTWQRVGRYLGNDTYDGQMLSLALTHSWRVEKHDIPNYAHGYDLDGNLLEAWAGLTEGWEGPSGGWVMTIGDLSRLIAALMNDQIVGATTLNEMKQQQTTVLGGYGQGIATEGGALYWHGGDIGGYASVWAWWPDASPKPFGVALMCNRAGPGFIATDLLDVAKEIRSLYSSGGGQAQSTLPPAGSTAASEVDEATFELDMRTARIVEPARFSLPLAGSEPLFLGIKALSPTSLEVYLVSGDDPLGKEAKHIDLGEVTHISGEHFRTRPLEKWSFNAPLVGDVVVNDMVIDAAFAKSGESLAEITMSATIDLRDLDSMADDGWPQICRNLNPRGTQCTACADGNLSCLRIKAGWIAGPRFDAGAKLPRP